MADSTPHGFTWRPLIAAAGAVVFVFALTVRSDAQTARPRPGPARPAKAPRVKPAPPDLSGIWSNQGAPGRCTPNGKTCPFKIDELPLNARAVAHWQAFDEIVEPKYDCVPATSPGIVLDPYMTEIKQQRDRVILFYEKDDVVRTAWLDGRKPKINEYSWQGFSTARYDGQYLIVDTTHFLYDPGGLDDQGGLASSTQKRVSEKYWRDGDLLRAEVTTEDPIFLTEPVTFKAVWRVAKRGAEMGTYTCDPEEARHPLQFFVGKFPPGRAKIPNIKAGPPDYEDVGGAK